MSLLLSIGVFALEFVAVMIVWVGFYGDGDKGWMKWLVIGCCRVRVRVRTRCAETRNQKSLRATAISFRVLDGSANLALIARNAGTSIGSIDLFYAKYLRGTDDLDAITTIKRTRKK